jgi:signal transduction histidine kinase
MYLLSRFVFGEAQPDQHQRLADAVRSMGEVEDRDGILSLLVEVAASLIDAREASFRRNGAAAPDARDADDVIHVPIDVREEPFGILHVTRAAASPRDREHDAAVLDVLAAAAGLAIDCVDRRAQVDELTTFTDRERIARDLHDTVIQRLFAIGLSLEGVVPRLPADLGDRVARTVVDIDHTIRRIRATIFDLETRRGDTSTVRRRVLDRCVDARAHLGSDPIVGFEGPVDTAVDEEMADHLLAVLDEALDNAAKHAQARRVAVDVDVELDPPALRLTVSDDGRGIESGEPEEGRGIRDMTRRAARLGGSCTLERGSNRGAVLRWEVPLPV